MNPRWWSFACIVIVATTPHFSRAQSLSPSESSAWSSGGPYVGEKFNCLVVSVADPDMLFAGGHLGLYQSMDGGITWVKRLDKGIREIAIAAGNANRVYASAFPGEGILKSDDGGLSWTESGLDNATVNALIVHPANADVVYAGTGEAERSSASEVLGVFKSEDGGDSWMLKTDDEIDAVLDLLLDMSNPDYVYAGVSPDGSRSFRRSTDGGETWEKYLSSSRSAHAVAMTPAGYATPAIYAMVGDDGIYKSLDLGVTWTDLDAPFSDGVMAVNPLNPEMLYAASSPYIYRSLDGGGSWDITAEWPDEPMCRPSDIVAHPVSGYLTLGCRNGQGFWRSEDEAQTWSFVVEVPTTANIRYLAAHPEDAQRVYAVLPGDYGKVTATADGGASWSTLENSPEDLGAVTVDPRNPSIIWVGTGYDFTNRFYVYNSRDFGNSWTQIEFARRSPGSSIMEVTDILVHPDNSNYLLLGSNRIWGPYGWDGWGLIARSLNGGMSWVQIGPASSSAMSLDPRDPNTVYNGKQESAQVFERTNVWENSHTLEITPSGIGDVNDIQVDISSNVYVATSNGLWKRDGGTWSTLTSLPSSNVTALAIDHSATPGIVYAGTSDPGGVFVSEDGGATWTDFSDGEDIASVNQLVLSGGFIYAAPHNAGVWKRVALAVNRAPSASFTATPTTGEAPLLVYFDASASSDPEGGDLDYRWDFGDGSESGGRTTSHTFVAERTYDVTLTVTDSGGLTAVATRQVEVGGKTVTLRNFDPEGGHSPWALDSTTPIDSGFVFGTNHFEDQAKATAFVLPTGMTEAEVEEVNVWFGYKKSRLADSTYTLEILAGDPSTGPAGTPLFSESFSFAHVNADEDFQTPDLLTTHTLSQDVRVGSSFFVSVDFGSYGKVGWASAAIVAGEPLGQRVPEVWEKWNDGSWHNLSDSWDFGSGRGTNGTHIWIEAWVRPVAVEGANRLPSAVALLPNYPNPFNPITTIVYDLPRLVDVTLTVYDVLGRHVRVLISGTQPPGTHEVSFDASGLSSGIYFYRLHAGDFVETKRMVVVR